MTEKARKGFAFLTIGFLIMGILMFFEELYRQAMLNVVIAGLFGVAYLRARIN